MSGYISRSKLIKDVENLKDCYNGFSDTYDKACIIGLIDEQPSIEELQKPKWIPVTKRLPEKDQEVLIFLFGEDPYIAWHNGEYWCTEDFRLDEPDDWQPTYWFPLPQPPKDGES